MTDITHVTDSDFEEKVARSELPVLIDFWAPWCGPCKMVAPLVEDIADEFEGKLVVAKVNVDDSPALTARMGIRGIPTLSLFRDGGMVAQQTGAGSLGQLRTFVKGNL